MNFEAGLNIKHINEAHLKYSQYTVNRQVQENRTESDKQN